MKWISDWLLTAYMQGRSTLKMFVRGGGNTAETAIIPIPKIYWKKTNQCNVILLVWVLWIWMTKMQTIIMMSEYTMLYFLLCMCIAPNRISFSLFFPRLKSLFPKGNINICDGISGNKVFNFYVTLHFICYFVCQKYYFKCVRCASK